MRIIIIKYNFGNNIFSTFYNNDVYSYVELESQKSFTSLVWSKHTLVFLFRRMEHKNFSSWKLLHWISVKTENDLLFY